MTDMTKTLESFMIPVMEGENIDNLKARFNAYWKTYRTTQKDAKEAARSGDYKTAAAKCRAGAKELRGLASTMKNAPADEVSAMLSHFVHAAVYVLKVQIGSRVIGALISPGLMKLFEKAGGELVGDFGSAFASGFTKASGMSFDSYEGLDLEDDYDDDVGTEGAAVVGLIASGVAISVASLAALVSEIVTIIVDIVKAFKAYRTVSRSRTSDAAKEANVIRNKCVAAITKSADLLDKRAKKYDEEAGKKK